jgi:hypothetical protein
VPCLRCQLEILVRRRHRAAPELHLAAEREGARDPCLVVERLENAERVLDLGENVFARDHISVEPDVSEGEAGIGGDASLAGRRGLRDGLRQHYLGLVHSPRLPQESSDGRHEGQAEAVLRRQQRARPLEQIRGRADVAPLLRPPARRGEASCGPLCEAA